MGNLRIPTVMASVLLVLTGCASRPVLRDVEWIDLTHSFDESTLYWPNNARGFEHVTDTAGDTPGGYYYSSYSLCTPEHGGTHLDAPVHFARDRQTVDAIPLANLTGEAVVVDVSVRALADRDYRVGIADLTAWEASHGRIPDRAIVLLRTGYGAFYPDRARYFGTERRGVEAVAELHFPGLDPAAAQWLLDARDVKAVGLDTPSLDYGQSKDFRTHRILLGANRPGF
ncbi:MAG: cyclase family protein, partial [Steroidobacteraceae bacterium]